VALDYETAGLSDADVAVMRFAEKLSTDVATMTDADSQSLRDLGFSDRQIVDIALAAGARNFFSRTLQALAVPVEDVPGLSPRLTEALLSPLAN
jgi:alkylhydroperoxidase family enzyme